MLNPLLKLALGGLDLSKPFTNYSRFEKKNLRIKFRDSNPGLLGEKRKCYFYAMLLPFTSKTSEYRSSKNGESENKLDSKTLPSNNIGNSCHAGD